MRDHPRSRGVYAHPPRHSLLAGGSSPLARGLLIPNPSSGPRSRIIPARAGFTRAQRARQPSAWDHPRSRGVYSPLLCVLRHTPGSSPLARGLPCSLHHISHSIRIIPARAGFTSPAPGLCCPSTDHPRSRGVYLGPLESRFAFVGSSPLARGLRVPGPTLGPEVRIIPARAGFTRSVPGPTSLGSDHPRSRGVYS